jgi:uncharacterized protein YxjI
MTLTDAHGRTVQITETAEERVFFVLGAWLKVRTRLTASVAEGMALVDLNGPADIGRGEG